VAKAVLDGRIDVDYGVYLKRYELEADKLKSDTAFFAPFEEPSR
jgi:hypothetical protein